MVRFWSSTSDSAITTIHWPYPLCGIMTLYDNGFPQFCFSLEITMNENKAYKQGRNITWHAAAHWIDVGENPTWNSFPNLATTIAFEILSTMLIILYLIGEKKEMFMFIDHMVAMVHGISTNSIKWKNHVPIECISCCSVGLLSIKFTTVWRDCRCRCRYGKHMAHKFDIFNKKLCFWDTISPYFTHGMPLWRCVYAIDDDNNNHDDLDYDGDVLFPLHIYPFTSRLDWLGLAWFTWCVFGLASQ